jgi:MFS family permease
MTRGSGGAVPTATVVGIALASALVPLNSTMIAVALPDIARDFDISTRQASLLVTLYLGAMLLGQPVAGRLADSLGARRLATLATSGFGVCSAAAMVAGSFELLVGLRTMQALFASALIPSVQSMLRALVPVRDRGRAFGIQGSVIGAGAGLGPVIGGLAIAAFGWRAIFGVNLPVVLAVLYVLRTSVPPTPTVHTATHPTGVGAGRLVNTVFGAAFAVQALSTFAQYALVLAVPIVLDGRGWSAASIGLALAFLTLGMVLVGPLGGRLGDRRGRRWPVVAGLTGSLTAVAISAGTGDEVAPVVIIVTLLVFGIGYGVASPSIQTAGIEAAPVDKVGAAAGLLSAGRYVGSITSTLVLAGVMADDGQEGLQTMLLVSVAFLAAALVAASRLPGRIVGAPVEDTLPVV